MMWQEALKLALGVPAFRGAIFPNDKPTPTTGVAYLNDTLTLSMGVAFLNGTPTLTTSVAPIIVPPVDVVHVVQLVHRQAPVVVPTITETITMSTTISVTESVGVLATGMTFGYESRFHAAFALASVPAGAFPSVPATPIILGSAGASPLAPPSLLYDTNGSYEIFSWIFDPMISLFDILATFAILCCGWCLVFSTQEMVTEKVKSWYWAGRNCLLAVINFPFKVAECIVLGWSSLTTSIRRFGFLIRDWFILGWGFLERLALMIRDWSILGQKFFNHLALMIKNGVIFVSAPFKSLTNIVKKWLQGGWAWTAGLPWGWFICSCLELLLRALEYKVPRLPEQVHDICAALRLGELFSHILAVRFCEKLAAIAVVVLPWLGQQIKHGLCLFCTGLRCLWLNTLGSRAERRRRGETGLKLLRSFNQFDGSMKDSIEWAMEASLQEIAEVHKALKIEKERNADVERLSMEMCVRMLRSNTDLEGKAIRQMGERLTAMRDSMIHLIGWNNELRVFICTLMNLKLNVDLDRDPYAIMKSYHTFQPTLLMYQAEADPFTGLFCKASLPTTRQRRFPHEIVVLMKKQTAFTRGELLVRLLEFLGRPDTLETPMRIDPFAFDLGAIMLALFGWKIPVGLEDRLNIDAIRVSRLARPERYGPQIEDHAARGHLAEYIVLKSSNPAHQRLQRALPAPGL